MTNPGNGWILSNNEYYIKGADEKELSTYNGNSHIEWYVWGNDMVGKIKNGKPYYFYKDHLGSTRCVVNSSGTIIAGYDYDAWGYPLENRSFNSDTIKFKFTGKETDKENFYDYFGVRYYDGRVANWISVDPLLEKHYDFSPYNYVLRNPYRFIDPDGRQVEVLGGAALVSLAEAALFTGVAIYAGYQLYQIYENYSSSTTSVHQSIFEKNDYGELVLSMPIEEITVLPSFTDKKKIKGIESHFRSIGKHLEKLGGQNPMIPTPTIHVKFGNYIL